MFIDDSFFVFGGSGKSSFGNPIILKNDFCVVITMVLFFEKKQSRLPRVIP